MRIVLDTNILVRAAGDEQGLAGHLLQEIISGPHILVVSPYILSEIARVLSYPRLQARWQLSEMTIAEFVNRLGEFAQIVLTTTPDRVVAADPDDDPIVQTAVLGKADFLCTRDSHVLDATVVEYCATYRIKVTNDIDLYHTLTSRHVGGGRAQQ
ncbi:MAG TPA: putative toxin-antitoxin system toxin component, PIN family [Candidatus Sulfopaludibacter sp.]|nr:putative toxin-antitoxin system toxin component, PIN family [Candidatus Sulfopaludibacter sp.]